MAKIILGLDIGGANLKAATSEGRALSVPFAVWKQPEKLGDAIRDLVAKFPEADEIAATMTAELCDCFDTKREGVKAIVDCLAAVSKNVRIWSTDGELVSANFAKEYHLKVAAANWHALATFVGQTIGGNCILLDIGTTTTDIIPIVNGLVSAKGRTDYERINHHELVYMGWRRTPLMTTPFHSPQAAELFATTLDAYLVLEKIAPDPEDRDTADGRPATVPHAMARMARMACADLDEYPPEKVLKYAETVFHQQCAVIQMSLSAVQDSTKSKFKNGYYLVTSGSGEFLAREVVTFKSEMLSLLKHVACISLSERIGPELSGAAPSYAVAVLAAERPR